MKQCVESIYIFLSGTRVSNPPLEVARLYLDKFNLFYFASFFLLFGSLHSCTETLDPTNILISIGAKTERVADNIFLYTSVHYLWLLEDDKSFEHTGIKYFKINLFYCSKWKKKILHWFFELFPKIILLKCDLISRRWTK